MSALPAEPNSGQYCATGASRSISPRSASRCTQVLVRPFVPEKTLAKVLSRQCRRRRASAWPPHRLTTRSPSTQTATAAPTSPRRVKLFSNSARTASNFAAHVPPMGGVWPLNAPPAENARAGEGTNPESTDVSASTECVDLNRGRTAIVSLPGPMTTTKGHHRARSGRRESNPRS